MHFPVGPLWSCLCSLQINYSNRLGLLLRLRKFHSTHLMWRILSLLPFLSKILEKVVFKQVSYFLAQNNLLDPKQSGLRVVILLKLLFYLWLKHSLAKALAQSSFLILLDLSAAFDSEPWHPPVYAVRTENFRESTELVWIVPQWTFIQCVLAGTSVKISPTLHWCTSGISTWTLLFSIYTTSLGEIIHSHMFFYHCYVDDTHLYFFSVLVTRHWIPSCLNYI